MRDDDGHDMYKIHFDDGNVSHDCPSWALMLVFMGHALAVILANLGGS